MRHGNIRQGVFRTRPKKIVFNSPISPSTVGRMRYAVYIPSSGKIAVLSSRGELETANNAMGQASTATNYAVGTFWQIAGAAPTAPYNSEGGTYTSSHFYAVGTDAISRCTSALGTPFSKVATSTPLNYKSIAVNSAGNRFVAVGRNTANSADRAYAFSSTGSTWTMQANLALGLWDRVVWCGDTIGFVALGVNVNSRSTLGSSGWTTGGTGPANAVCEDVAWSPDLGCLVAVYANGTAYRSTNGSTFTAVSIGGACKGITWCAAWGVFIAVGTNFCAQSEDGITWTPITIPNGSWRAIAFHEASQFLLVAEDTSSRGVTAVKR